MDLHLNPSDLRLELLLPEFIVAGTALGVILAEVLSPRGRRAVIAPIFAALGLVGALAVLVLMRPDGWALPLFQGDATTPFLAGWRSDAFARLARALVLAGGTLIVFLSVPYSRRMDRGHGEFYGLLLFALLGVMLVAGVSDLLSLFVCLELVTISSYVLAAFRRTDLKSTEAGLKYLVIGAISSAILLMGIALTYGAVGDVSLDAVAGVLSGAEPPSLLLMAGLVLIVVGILFKAGAVPFHVWIPDVYEGAPSPVTAFLSTASKAAGVFLLLRLAQSVFIPWAKSPWAATNHGLLWVWIFGVIAAVTLVFGLFGALPQRGMKRFFGYSSIGHAGYLLMGIAAVAAARETGDTAPGGATAVLFYLLAFFFTNLTAFTVIVLISAATGGRHGAESYRGMWKRAPFLALAMTLALLSLAGIPPLAGFFGKFLILKSLVDAAGAVGWGLFALAFLGAAGVAVSLFFYLRWIREMYFEDPEPLLADEQIQVGPWAGTVLVVGITAMLGMGVYMGPFYDLARMAAAALVSGTP
jgi:NADH-quinone oxidoreductase subunit N